MIFCQKISFYNLQKELKNTVPNTVTIDWSKMLPKISEMTKTRILIYTLNKYNLQTRIVSFPHPENLLKEVVVRLTLFMNANIA